MITDLSILSYQEILLKTVAAQRHCQCGCHKAKPAIQDIVDHAYFKCPICSGTGKVPILSPALMRIPCPNYQATKAFTLGSGWTMEACVSRESYCRAGKDDCKGSGWIPNPDPWDMREALHQAGFQLVESHIPSYYRDTSNPWMADCFDYTRIASPGLPTRSFDPKWARLLAVVKAFQRAE